MAVASEICSVPIRGAGPEAKLFLTPEALVIGKSELNPDATLIRRAVYGCSKKGSEIHVHAVGFSSGGKVKEPSSGSPLLDDPEKEWYPKASWLDKMIALPDEATAAEWAKRVYDWATPAKSHFHIIVNPNSGSRAGEKVWSQLSKRLKMTDHSVECYMTKGPGDATRIAQSLEMKGNDIIAAVGGDGTMCEALNGLMARSDARKGAFTICFIPAGSANAMAHMTGCGDPVTATWALIKGETAPMDIFAFYQNEKVQYGFLSVTKGMVADIDIDSEMCRCCGPSRFLMYTITKLFCCCCCCCCCPVHHATEYKARIRWIPADGTPREIEVPPTKPTFSHTEGEWREWEGTVQFFHLLNAPAVDKTMKLAPETKLNDGELNLQWMTPVSRCALVNVFDRIEATEHVKDKEWEFHRVRAVSVDNIHDRSKVVLDGERAGTGQAWQAEPMPKFVNVVVGSGTLSAFR